MDNQRTQDQVAALKPVSDGHQTVTWVAKMKMVWSKPELKQVGKLAFLALALVVWYPIYSHLDSFSRWVAYDLCRFAQIGRAHV